MMSVSQANNRATQLLRLEKPAEALEILEKTLSASNDISPAAKSTLLANKGLCLEQLGMIDKAVAALERAKRECPTNEDAVQLLTQLKATQLLSLAVQKAEANEFSNALALFEEAGRLDPNGDGTWLYNKARMLTKLGRTKEALDALLTFKEGLDEDEEQEQNILLPLLGELLCKCERWEQAVSVIDGAIAANLEMPASLLFNYGVALLKTHQLSKARLAFDDVIACYPNYGLAYDALANIDAQEGVALCKRGAFSEAIPKLYAAVRRTPKSTTMYNLALALLKERRAPEAKEQFDMLLQLDTKHPHAREGSEAARLMIEGGEYRDAPEEQDQSEDYYNNYPSAAVAPRKRIYEIANEKGVGSLASQDDMVMLLSGIEEWVAGALGPLEERVVALEQAAEASGGVVGSVSEDRAVLQLLFDRVSSLEESQQDASYGEYEPTYEDTTASEPMPTPDFAAQFDIAANARKVSAVKFQTESLDKRIRALEKLVFGTTKSTPQNSALSGAGLLGDVEDDAHEDGIEEHQGDSAQSKREALDPGASMSMTARLAVQEQRFAKMASEMEDQAKEIGRLKDAQERLLAKLEGGGPPVKMRGGPFGTGGPPNFKIEKKSRKTESGANVGAIDAPNMLDELKAATKRRAAKRRQLGLTLQD